MMTFHVQKILKILENDVDHIMSLVMRIHRVYLTKKMISLLLKNPVLDLKEQEKYRKNFKIQILKALMKIWIMKMTILSESYLKKKFPLKKFQSQNELV